MQMHDALRRAVGGTVVADLATTFDLAPAAAEAALRATTAELAWYIERNTLSRGGLADVVETLGSGDHAKRLDKPDALRDPATRADGEAILEHILGSRGRSAAVAARVARRSGASKRTARSMLPILAVIAMAAMESRGQGPLGEILAVMPLLGRRSRGSPHADLADILRRRCGGGPYAPAKLRRVVRRAVARATGFPARGAVRWYLQFILIRRAIEPSRQIAARAFRTRAR
jgi:hypothetical protein